jgi:hypothetical protein
VWFARSAGPRGGGLRSEIELEQSSDMQNRIFTKSSPKLLLLPKEFLPESTRHHFCPCKYQAPCKLAFYSLEPHLALGNSCIKGMLPICSGLKFEQSMHHRINV